MLRATINVDGSRILLGRSGKRSCHASMAYVLSEAHATWNDKIGFAATGKLSWSPKYTEADVGIAEYVKKKKQGVRGVLKGTWSDFVVQEVRIDDRSIVKLPADDQHKDDATQDENSTAKHKWLKFTLCKMGLDTISAIRIIARMTNIPYTSFRFAGIKDKYGITMQEITLMSRYSKKFEDLMSFEYKVKNGKIWISDIKPCINPLHSGELYGNRFVIVIRNVTLEHKQMNKAVRRLTKKGFLNYFGMQRFGGGSIPCLEAGRELLMTNYTAFAECIMSTRLSTNKQEIEAKQRYERHGARRDVMNLLPSYCIGTLMGAVSQLNVLSSGETVLGGKVAREICQVSERSQTTRAPDILTSELLLLPSRSRASLIKRYGSKRAVEGDIVLLETIGGGQKGKKMQRIKIVTRQDSQDGAYSIFDVVLPMFAEGRKVVLPKNSVGKWLKRRMKVEKIRKTMKEIDIDDADGCCVPVDRDDYDEEMPTATNQGTSSKKFSEICKFRHVVVRPQGMTSSIRRYSRWATTKRSS
eukprot:750854-Hanusia_phi.AAC.3